MEQASQTVRSEPAVTTRLRAGGLAQGVRGPPLLGLRSAPARATAGGLEDKGQSMLSVRHEL